MTRAFLASLVAVLVLMAVVAFLLIGQGKRDATIRDLKRDAVAMTKLREDDAKRVKLLEARNGALLTAQAVACGAEGTDAFDRGVRTGIAVCQARATTPVQ